MTNQIDTVIWDAISVSAVAEQARIDANGIQKSRMPIVTAADEKGFANGVALLMRRIKDGTHFSKSSRALRKRKSPRVAARTKAKPKAARAKRMRARAQHAAHGEGAKSGDDGSGSGDGDPDPADPTDHAPDRRSHSSSPDAHSYAAWDPNDPTPQCRTTVWPVAPDPVVFHGVCASSWRQISAVADGRVREVCRLLGADIEIDDAADELLCSGHTARDDAKEIFDAIVSKRINVAAQQLDLFADPEPAYIPKRSTRGRKKKPRGGPGGAK